MEANSLRGAPAPQRQYFTRFVSISSRWMDNDVYGHINNVVYYSFFDTAVNGLMLEAELLDPKESPVIALVVETQCTYRRSLSFPELIEVGVRVAHLGTTSIRYEIGVFAAGSAERAANGQFVHVYVDAVTRRPALIPPACRSFLDGLRGPSST